MSDFPTPDGIVTPTHISSYSHSPAVQRAAAGVSGALGSASITWVANLAVFIPITIGFPYTVRRIFWANGSVTTTTNADFGIYNNDGDKLYSQGSVALGLAAAVQYPTAPPSFVLPPGRYFFAYTNDGTTNRARGSTSITTIVGRQSGIFQQASAGPGSLPATMASVVAMTNQLFPLCGITRSASGF